mgnify:CR=1 FL=1
MESPIQIKGSDGKTPIGKLLINVMVTELVLLQPLASVPVTVYVALEEGTKGTPFEIPPVHK